RSILRRRCRCRGKTPRSAQGRARAATSRCPCATPQAPGRQEHIMSGGSTPKEACDRGCRPQGGVGSNHHRRWANGMSMSRNQVMQEQLGLGVIPGAGWRAAEISQIAREAEEAGFTALFAAEVNNDVLATVQ